MRTTSIIISCALLMACGNGCALFKARPASTVSDELVSPGELSAPLITIAQENQPNELSEPQTDSILVPLIFGAGDAVGRALYEKYIVFVRAQTTPRQQLIVGEPQRNDLY